MKSKKKEVFEIKDKESGKATSYAVMEPSPANHRAAQKVYNATFAECVGAKTLLRKRLTKHMMEQGLWDEEKETEYRDTAESINNMEMQLRKGGIKLSEAKKIALEMSKKRNHLRSLIAERNSLDVNTAEGQSENARFNCLVSLCLVYNDTGEPVYKSMDEYLENNEEEVSYRGAELLAQMLFNIDKNHDANLPENQFLKEWNFVDDELRLIDKQGRLVDEEGRLIDEEGYYINEDGQRISLNGIPVDEKGEYIIESSPFLDDDGNPIGTELVVAEDEEATTPVKRGRKKKTETDAEKDEG